ncbi:NTPase KAP family P-loop domain-containing protein 1-like isoform X2 [Macrotis lagotis]
MNDKASKFGMESESLINNSGLEPSSPISENNFNGMNNKDHLPDEVYCETLGKILHHAETPVTVGLYGACRHRLRKVMGKIQKHILAEAEQSEETSNSQGCIQFCHQIPLLLKIVLCVPKKLPEKTNNKTHYIFVPFQAWEFAGSDFLWAGLFATLCGCIEKKYQVLLFFYKRFGIPVQEKVTWRVVIYYRKLILFLVLVISFIAIVSCSFIYHWDIYGTMKTFLYPLVPLTAVAIWELVRGIYTFYQTSQKTINKLIKNTKFSDQLGFMHSVKEQIEGLTKFLDVLDVYNKQQTKVVLQITHLDACPPEKVMGALEALSILLSDPEAPFISILAADSKIIAESVERSGKVGNMPGAGYQYLNRLITLPFSLPHMNKEKKKNLLEEFKFSEKKDKQSCQMKKGQQPRNRNRDPENGRKNCNDSQASFTAEFKTIINNLQDKFCKFLPNKEAQMKQVIYNSWVTLKLREWKFGEKWEPGDSEACKEVIAWILMANEWPFRVNWLLQYAEDTQQWREINSKHQCIQKSNVTQKLSTVGALSSPKEGNNSLKEAFCKAIFELDSVKEEVKKLMELDRDPEIFFQLLQFLEDEDINLDVQKALDYWEITPNLHRSLKQYMELIRGSRTLKQAARCYQLLPLPLLKMSKDEVCEELRNKASDLNISETNMEQYIDKIQKENLNGKALVYSHNSDIKKTLGMSLGDWTSFSIHFLNVLPEDNTSLAAILREEGLGVM